MSSCPVSVVITTHNRASMLPRSVPAALAEARRHAGAEVIVVDNASTDDTPATLATLQREGGSSLRVLHEARLGASFGRNRGVAEARGAMVAFLDDDAVPRPGWLGSLLGAFTSESIGGAGGPLVLEFSAPPPRWLTPAFHEAAGAYDLGGARRRVQHRGREWYPPSANLCLRTADVVREGGFCSAIGPRGDRHLVHEDIDLCARMDRRGREIHYVPEAVVDHCVVPEKLTPRYFLSHHECFGEGAAVFALRNRGVLRALSAIRWHARYLAARPYEPHDPIDPERLLAECQRREALGYLRSLARNLRRLGDVRRDLAPLPSC